MTCITPLVSLVAVATTQFPCAVRYDISDSGLSQYSSERQPLRMNWVVVIGKDGSRQLRMRWKAAGS